jgi:hypothetical protein
VNERGAEGVLLTGVYASGKSSVTEEIAYLPEQRGEPCALLDLDYLSWAGTGTGDRASEFGLMVQNLATVAANYRRAGIRLFALALGNIGEREISVSGSDDSTVRIWDLERKSTTIIDLLAPVNAVGISTAGALCVATGTAICLFTRPS